MATSRSTDAPKTTIQSVERASRLVLAIAEADVPPSARELAQRFELTVPTAHNILRTLVQEGLLERNVTGGYQLGALAALIAYRVSSTHRMPSEYVDAMREVAEETGETVYLASWRSGRVVATDVVQSVHPLRVVASPMGNFGDDHARSTGKLMVALARDDLRERMVEAMDMKVLTPNTNTDKTVLKRELEHIKQTNIAHDDQEYVYGAHGFAVPIWAGNVAAACIAVHAPIDRWNERADFLIEAARKGAQRASRLVEK